VTVTERLVQDVRYAVRMFGRSPGYAAVTLATLALGIGANTAIFSVLDAVLLRPLPIPEPERVVVVASTVRREDVERRSVSYPDFLDWRARSGVFEEMAAHSNTTFSLTGIDQPERLEGEMVSAAYFRILGAAAQVGRTFTGDEDRTMGTHPVAVLGHGLWQRRFGADPGIVGRTIRLNETGVTVIGVMPEGFLGLDGDTDVWTPMAMMSLSVPARFHEGRGQRWHGVLARLRPGVVPAEAQAAMDTMTEHLAAEHRSSNENYGALVIPLREETLGPLRPVLLVLMAAVGFVLLIACANVANLMLTRAWARQKESAIRVALGASRSRLLRQFLTESLVASLLGGLHGVLLAVWAVEVLGSARPLALPAFVHVGIDARVLAFTAAVATLTGLLLAVLPAAHASSADVNEALKEGGRSSADGGRGRVRGLLVVSEVALALLPLVGAGLMVQSLRRMQSIDPGFSADGLLTFSLSLPAGSYPGVRAAELAGHLEERLGALPSVTAVAVASDLPLAGSSSAGLYTAEGSDREFRAYRHSVSPGFFETAGVRLLAGRAFLPHDRADAPGVVVVSEKLARRQWPGGSAVDRRLKPGRPDSPQPFLTVVGVVRDVKHRVLVDDAVRSPDDPDVYFPLAQRPDRDLGVLVRSAADPAALAAAARREVHALDRDVPVYAVQPMRDLVARQSERSRFGAWLMGLFGALALALAAIGVYGVLSHTVAQRRHEIGVRMALGADAATVLRLVLADALGLVLAGVGIGMAGAAALTRLLAAQLYEVSPRDPATFAVVAALLVLTALVAAWLPARQAMRVDPIVALRRE
jgi:putative ABC transport system permease protein